MSFQDIFKKSFLSMSENSLISPVDILIIMGMSFFLGLLIFWIYKKTYQGVLYTRSYNISLIMITMTTAMIIMTISSNVILSLGMVGALSIVRFRTAIKDPMDIVFMFWAIAAGIAVGAKFFPIAILGSAIIAVILFVLSRIKTYSTPYLLVINYSPQQRQSIQAEVKKLIRGSLKSEVISAENIEVTYELRLKEGQTEIIHQIAQLSGVTHAVLISQTGNTSL